MTSLVRYRVLRRLGRLVTHSAALLTFGAMPPFVSCSAVVRRNGQVLVVLDPLLGEPVLPGGHLAWRETPEEAMVREVREETGLSVVAISLVGVYSGVERAGEQGIVRIVYVAELTGGSLQSSGEGEAGWMAESEFILTARRDGTILSQVLAPEQYPATR